MSITLAHVYQYGFITVTLPLMVVLFWKLFNVIIRPSEAQKEIMKLHTKFEEMHTDILQIPKAERIEKIEDRLDYVEDIVKENSDNIEEIIDSIGNELKYSGKLLLYVEDDEYVSFTIKEQIERLGFIVTLKRSYEDALEALSQFKYDVGLFDYKLSSKKTGLDLIDWCKKNNRFVKDGKNKMILITGFLDEINTSEFDDLLLLKKPCNLKCIVNAIEQTME